MADDAWDGLLKNGLRLTRQRRVIAEKLSKEPCRHLTAEVLHAELKAAGEQLSLATVYNALREFSKAGLIRQIPARCGPAQFDIRPGNHHHFFIPAEGRCIDIEPAEVSLSRFPRPPSGYRIAAIDVTIHLEPALAPNPEATDV